jgi:hypothetical protein
VIITHTQNANGERRIYLGGKGSMECWLEPQEKGWTFKLDAAVTGQPLDQQQSREWATHILLQLAETLNVSHHDLAAVPFETIAALHSTDPFAGRRTSLGRRRPIEQGFVSTAPNIRRPQAEFVQRPHPGNGRQFR